MSTNNNQQLEDARATEAIAPPGGNSLDAAGSPGSISTLAKIDLLRQVQAVARRIYKLWDKELRRRRPDLSATRAAVMLQLGRGGGASQARLACLLGVSQMAVSQLLDDLESRGWILREAVPIDRRAWAVRLTDKGRQVFTVVHAVSLAFADRSCAAIDEEHRTKFAETLAALESGAAATRPAVPQERSTGR
jgi:DNA-binding MarR family transcriptional regulator